jgi:hypothetical protein
VCVDEEQQGGCRKNPPRCSTRRFKDDDRCDCAQNEIDGRRRGRTQYEGIEIYDRPGERDDRQQHAQDVERDAGHPETAACWQRKQENRGDQGDQQKADAIDLRIDNADDPVQRIDRKREGQHFAGALAKTGRY